MPLGGYGSSAGPHLWLFDRLQRNREQEPRADRLERLYPGLTLAAGPPPAWMGFRPLRVSQMQRVFLFLAGAAPEADAAGQSLAAWVRPKLGLG